MPQTFFHNSPYSQKYDLICFTPYLWQPCISQFCDITKGIILQKFMQIKKRNYHLVPVSSLTKSENLATATEPYRPRLTVLMYICRPFVISQNSEMQGCQ